MFQQDRSADVRRFVVGFIEEAWYKDEKQVVLCQIKKTLDSIVKILTFQVS